MPCGLTDTVGRGVYQKGQTHFVVVGPCLKV